MERWDFDCQKCFGNIGNAYYVEPEWYQCKKERESKEILKDHDIQGSGRGRVGYCFDAKCAKDLNYKCPVCGSKLVRITADQHPGGEWGIRGVREPGEFRPW